MINFRLFLILPMFVLNLNGKELKRPEIKLLNGTLKKKGNVTVRLEYSCKLAKKTLDAIRDEQVKELDKVLGVLAKEEGKTQEKNIINNNAIKREIHIILSPVKEFFVEIKAHASILKPLIEESLKPLVTKNRDISSFYFMQFFENPSRDVMEFLEAKVVTYEDLEHFCEELAIFSQDILDSRSDEVKEIHEQIVRQLKNKSHVKHEVDNKLSSKKESLPSID